MKSFIATSVLQHNLRSSLVPAVILAAVVGAFCYWVGQKNAIQGSFASITSHAGSAAQSPLTIVNANSRTDSPPEPSQVSVDLAAQTIGKLHADILTLRTLYRRLAEDAGLDLTDFDLSDAISPPTQTEDVDDVLKRVSEQLELIKESSAALEDWYKLRSQERAFNLSGPVVMQGQLSSRFGWRKRPSTGEMKMHKGIDFSGAVGEPVMALADGVVSFEGSVHAYGNMVEILHADGLLTRYAHNDANVVSLGQRVEQGQIIARLGSTGRSTGPHVHVEVHLNGQAVDPMLFIQ